VFKYFSLIVPTNRKKIILLETLPIRIDDYERVYQIFCLSTQLLLTLVIFTQYNIIFHSDHTLTAGILSSVSVEKQGFFYRDD